MLVLLVDFAERVVAAEAIADPPSRGPATDAVKCVPRAVDATPLRATGRVENQPSRGDWIRTSDLYVPNVAL